MHQLRTCFWTLVMIALQDRQNWKLVWISVEAGLAQHTVFLEDKQKKLRGCHAYLGLYISQRNLSQMSCLFTCRFPVNNMLNLKPYSGKICTAGLKGRGKAGNFSSGIHFGMAKGCSYQSLFLAKEAKSFKYRQPTAVSASELGT